MEKIKENLKNMHKNKPVRTIIGILLFLIVVLTAFQAGVFIGYRKASFSNNLGNRYYRQAFEDGKHDGSFGFFGGEIPSGSGAVGKIVRIDQASFVVATPDNIEKTIKITDDTLIRKFRDKISLTDLKIGDQVIVLGGANEKSEIEAKLVRLLPPPPIDENLATSTQATSSQQ